MSLFFIPSKHDKNNSLTSNDITSGKLRVTIDNKKHFPNEDCDITIIINNKEYVCKFRLNSDDKDRSYVILLGKEAITQLDLKSKDILECERLGDKKYKLTK